METQNEDKISYGQDRNEEIVDIFADVCDLVTRMPRADELMAFMVGKLSSFFSAQRVSIMLLDESKEELSLRAGLGIVASDRQIRLKVGDSFGGLVA